MGKLILLILLITCVTRTTFSQSIDSSRIIQHHFPYIYDIDSVFSYENYQILVIELKNRIPSNLYSEFKSNNIVVSVKVRYPGVADSVYILISSGSCQIDTIVSKTIFDCRFRYSESLKNKMEYIYFSIPIERKYIIGRRNILGRFLPFIK